MSGERLLVGAPHPIYAMPILEADEARPVRMEKTQMPFGDAKRVIGEVVDELWKIPAKEVVLR